ncbi:hypothetical protein BJV78DRAFT_1230009 [Lactifluus subvellereus]|nr:hypothetical protein BJV78DRAFT_1230009 [Lactifluus subvellereus]
MLHGRRVKSLCPLHVKGFTPVRLEFVLVPIEKCVDPILPNWCVIMPDPLCQNRICMRFDAAMCEGEASISGLNNKIHKNVFLGFKKFLLFLISSIHALLIIGSSCKCVFINAMIFRNNTKTAAHLGFFEQFLAVCLNRFPKAFLDPISVDFLLLTT